LTAADAGEVIAVAGVRLAAAAVDEAESVPLREFEVTQGHSSAGVGIADHRDQLHCLP
jgi:hypothetical protein